jgi:signal transduction histidine kinase
MIREAAERCGKIVHSLMRGVRRREQRYEAVDIPAMLQLALDLAWNGTTPFGLNITTHIAANLPKPFGDPEQIAHIMSNLVSNATQALESADLQRPKMLCINAEIVDTDIVIRVVDNGPGIAPEIKERIFDPFFSTKPPEKGTGVGLALCRALARAHGGSLVVEDTPGGGATFVLRLPLSG